MTGNLTNVVIPRPSYNGEEVPGIGMVKSPVDLFLKCIGSLEAVPRSGRRSYCHLVARSLQSFKTFLIPAGFC